MKTMAQNLLNSKTLNHANLPNQSFAAEYLLVRWHRYHSGKRNRRARSCDQKRSVRRACSIESSEPKTNAAANHNRLWDARTRSIVRVESQVCPPCRSKNSGSQFGLVCFLHDKRKASGLRRGL